MILRGDARALPLADETVDLIVTSPPYFSLRSYRDAGKHLDGQIGDEPTPQEFLESLWAVTSECWRVLKPSGSMFVNLGDKRTGSGGHNNATLSRHGTGSSTLDHPERVADRNGRATRNRLAPQRTGDFATRKHNSQAPRLLATRRNAPDRYNQAGFGRRKSKMLLPHRYAIGCEDGLADVEGLGWIVRSDIVWWKANCLPESVQDRVHDRHEYWFHLTKSETYFSTVDEIRDAYEDVSYAANGHRQDVHSHSEIRRSTGYEMAVDMQPNPLGRIPGSVWKVASEPLHVPAELEVDHFAAFPTEWPRRLILGWSPPGGVVLDPFGGTGTVAMVARALDRSGINVDLSADYCRLADWRIHRSGHGAKAVSRTWKDRQGDIFDTLLSDEPVAAESPSPSGPIGAGE